MISRCVEVTSVAKVNKKPLVIRFCIATRAPGFELPKALEGGGLGMLVFLHRWSRNHGIQLKLFDPPNRVQRKLKYVSSEEFEIVGTDEVLSLLEWEVRSKPADAVFGTIVVENPV